MSHVCFPNCLSERASWHSVMLTAKAIIVSACFSLMLPAHTIMIVNRNVVVKNAYESNVN